jgi:hypothetical protein
LNFPVINQQAVQCDEIAKILLDNKQLPSHITGEVAGYENITSHL